MNKAQERTLELIKGDATAGGREVRRCETDEFATLGTVLVTMETGMVGDDGSLESIRKRRGYCFLIGPRGGVSERRGGTWRKVRGRKVTNIYADLA